MASTIELEQKKLVWEAILLDEKKKLQAQLRETFTLSCDKVDDNNEDRIIFSKLGKVFCEKLVFCVDNSLWQSDTK